MNGKFNMTRKWIAIPIFPSTLGKTFPFVVIDKGQQQSEKITWSQPSQEHYALRSIMNNDMTSIK